MFDLRKGRDVERAVRNAFAGQSLYEDTRTALTGVHLIENALWRVRHFDYLMHVFSL